MLACLFLAFDYRIENSLRLAGLAPHALRHPAKIKLLLRNVNMSFGYHAFACPFGKLPCDAKHVQSPSRIPMFLRCQRRAFAQDRFIDDTVPEPVAGALLKYVAQLYSVVRLEKNLFLRKRRF